MRRASLGTLFLTVFLDLVGFGLIIPFLPALALGPVVGGALITAGVTLESRRDFGAGLRTPPRAAAPGPSSTRTASPSASRATSTSLERASQKDT